MARAERSYAGRWSDDEKPATEADREPPIPYSGFRSLSGWAFGPRNFMKTRAVGRRNRLPSVGLKCFFDPVPITPAAVFVVDDVVRLRQRLEALRNTTFRLELLPPGLQALSARRVP